MQEAIRDIDRAKSTLLNVRFDELRNKLATGIRARAKRKEVPANQCHFCTKINDKWLESSGNRTKHEEKCQANPSCSNYIPGFRYVEPIGEAAAMDE